MSIVDALLRLSAAPVVSAEPNENSGDKPSLERATAIAERGKQAAPPGDEGSTVQPLAPLSYAPTRLGVPVPLDDSK